MRPDLFSGVISFDEARRRVLDAARPIARREIIPIHRADGRVMAVDVRSPMDVPAFDRAAMDGYALIAADTEAATAEHPAQLALLGAVYTGDVPVHPVTPGGCMVIATGAPLPAGADAVVMVERTERSGETVRVATRVAPGQNIGRRGADLAQGDRVLTTGDVLSPAGIGSAAAIGLPSVEVFAKPSVALLSTGNEITAPGQRLPDGHVYDVNRFTMGAVVERHGGIATPMSAAGDTIDALTAALDSAVAHDVVVFSGGSSVGDRDLMLDALERRGTIDFHGIAIKPGKPTLFGHIGATPVFGMPGNPTSCLSNAYLLLVPFLRRVARLPEWRPLVIDAPLRRRLVSPSDRHQFYPVRIENGGVEPVFKSSGDITSMAHAHGYVEIPAGVDEVPEGTRLTVTIF
jgi:molybdopterin molybdotransferase